MNTHEQKMILKFAAAVALGIGLCLSSSSESLAQSAQATVITYPKKNCEKKEYKPVYNVGQVFESYPSLCKADVFQDVINTVDELLHWTDPAEWKAKYYPIKYKALQVKIQIDAGAGPLSDSLRFAVDDFLKTLKDSKPQIESMLTISGFQNVGTQLLTVIEYLRRQRI